MVQLKSMANPKAVLEAAAAVAPAQRKVSQGGAGAGAEPSRSLRFLGVSGKMAAPVRPAAIAALESVIGPTDDRVRILDTELYPWRMICALRMTGANGGSAIGTGWLVGPRTVITAGHCVYSEHFFGGWASSIELSPGRNGTEFPHGSFTSTSFHSVDRWVESEDPDFDIGVIHLDEPIGEQLGWFALGTLTPKELEGYLVNVSGYPADRGRGTEQYHHKNQILNVTERRVFYDVDTFGGQSGAPVWIHETPEAPPVVVGIHAYGVGGSAGVEANSAPRIIPEVWEQIREWVEADGGWPA